MIINKAYLEEALQQWACRPKSGTVAWQIIRAAGTGEAEDGEEDGEEGGGGGGGGVFAVDWR